MITHHDSIITAIPVHLLPAPLAYIDVETMPYRGQQRIVEICLLRYDPMADAPVMYSTLVDPGIPPYTMGQRAWRHLPHRLSLSDVAQAPAWPMVQSLVRNMCRGATIVAHNAHFERRVLAESYARYGQRWDHQDYLCTLKLARLLEHGRRRNGAPKGTPGTGYRLTDLCRDMGIGMVPPHRATGDVMCTIGVLGALLARHQHRPDLAQLVRQATL